MRSITCTIALVFTSLACLQAGDLDWSDPAKLPPPKTSPVGWPSRAPDLDVLPGFQNPPPGYGAVPFYWWLGDRLTKERLAWQLDQLEWSGGISGLQVNYAHTDRGGRSYGLTMPSDPPLFSQAWWDLFRWFLGECRKRGMATSLSDYTLCTPGQGWYSDEILKENPAINGATLRPDIRDVAGGAEVAIDLADSVISVAAYRLEGGNVARDGRLDLRAQASNGKLRWRAPDGKWKLVIVSCQKQPFSIDPLNPLSGRKVVEKFFQPFEDRCPGEGGRGLNFFFSDELDLGIGGNLWSEQFAAEFRKRKGYDLTPELAALFMDIGARTPKVRLDYHDVLVTLSEESYFRPIFQWHYDRGMTYGCDHGGRGRNVAEFGDYFRTQRWMTGPGCDQPGLSSDVIKNKVAASIVHLYQRPRVWLEGYHSSGWGTSSAALTDATLRNYVQGHNLLGLHGLYYSLHGGWWEWAPPCNHFRMPYWQHMRAYFDCVRRLSYLMSQGVHRCDVAILYPVAAVEAGMGGNEAVAAAFSAGEDLYAAGIDFDFIDFESLARAKVEERELRVSGEGYRVLVLPSMAAVRDSTLKKALEFYRQGGVVLAVGVMPEASDRAGREDAELDAAVKEIFGLTAREAKAGKKDAVRKNAAGGTGRLIAGGPRVVEVVRDAIPRDFAVFPSGGASVNHRKIGARDVYMVHGAPQGTECAFRARGKVELWDPWTGQVHPLPVLSQTADGTRLRLPLEPNEAQIIVFSPGEPRIAVQEARKPETAVISLDGPWQFELKPTMDNRWGDFHWPPTNTMIGAEARRFRYADEALGNGVAGGDWQSPAFDDSRWTTVTYSFGQRFWKLGPLPEEGDASALEAELAKLTRIDPAVPLTIAGKPYRWEPYSYSTRFGIEGDPGHQGYHGLKEEIHDEFIGLGRLHAGATDTSYGREDGGSRYYLWTSAAAERNGPAHALVGGMKPAAVWLNGARLEKPEGKVQVRAGTNPLLLRYDNPGRAYFVLDTTDGEGRNGQGDEPPVFSRAASYIWYPKDGEGVADRCFRKTFNLEKPAARAELRITCDNGYTVILNGRELGRGNQWSRVQQYDVVGQLKQGKNTLAVLAHNDGGPGGLIAELTLSGPDGLLTIATDGTWRCSPQEQQGWREAGFDDSRWAKAEVVSTFDESLWAAHPQGPPILDRASQAPRPFKVSPLASRWHGKPGLLAYDAQPQAAKPAGWYRFTSPPGLRAMTITARGTVQAWAEGKELAIEPGKKREDGAVEYRAVVKEPAPDCVKVAIRVEQDRGHYGGATLPEPIALDCGPGAVNLGDWSRIDGLASYSGGAWYRKTVTLSAEQAKGPVLLKLGEVVTTAEVRVNGRLAGIKVAPPWSFDISKFAQSGENRIEVLVYNTLANHYLTIPTRYRGSPVSGLLGPVTIETVTIETVTAETTEPVIVKDQQH